jgi:hypothetical protein
VALGLKGGGGNFGVVIAAELALPPVAQVYAGILFYPVGRADEVLSRYGSWSRMLPDEMTTAVAFRRFPRLPAVPEPLRGHTFVTVRGCWSGEDLAEGERLLKPLREGLGEPNIDTFTVLPTADLDAVSMDPVAPARAFQHSEMLRELTAEAVDTLVGLGTYSPLIMLELRQLGGALSQPVGELSPIAYSNARFALTAVGPTPTPESIGTTYVNFLDLDGATPERVRAAYSSDDWARLVQLKYRYDPHNVFRFNRNVPPGGHGPVLPR